MLKHTNLHFKKLYKCYYHGRFFHFIIIDWHHQWTMLLGHQPTQTIPSKKLNKKGLQRHPPKISHNRPPPPQARATGPTTNQPRPNHRPKPSGHLSNLIKTHPTDNKKQSSIPTFGLSKKIAMRLKKFRVIGVT